MTASMRGVILLAALTLAGCGPQPARYQIVAKSPDLPTTMLDTVTGQSWQFDGVAWRAVWRFDEPRKPIKDAVADELTFRRLLKEHHGKVTAAELGNSN
jgi:hypothetical protein